MRRVWFTLALIVLSPLAVIMALSLIVWIPMMFTMDVVAARGDLRKAWAETWDFFRPGLTKLITGRDP